MKLKIITVLCCLSFTLMASAQASGGQIRRNSPKPKKEVQKTSKPRHTKVQTEQKDQTEQNVPSYTAPAVPDVPITPLSNLPTYNLVIATFSLRANAQSLFQSMKEKGYSTKICMESTTPPMYRVIVASSYTYSDIVDCANKLKSNFPGSWILCVENGQTRKIRID